MKSDNWRRVKRVEEEFNNTLQSLVKIFGKIASTTTTPEAFASKMEKFQRSTAYENFITSAVKRMVTPLAVSNMATWRRAARKATQSRMLYNSLLKEINSGIEQDITAQILENATLIRTLPLETAKKVTQDIAELTLKGYRASDIAVVLREVTEKHARASARLIARTEVSKTTTALTRARSINLGLKWYVWRTAHDGDRVRDSHQIMEDVLVAWDNPPSPEALNGESSVGNYHAGNIWNCRCYPEPLIDIEDVKWPHKVHINGQIKTIGKEEFKNGTY